MSSENQFSVVLLYDESAKMTGTVDNHISAFKRFSRHNVAVLDSSIASRMSFDLTMFDAIVFHYSVVISMPTYLPDALLDRLAAFRGPKILFVQDEFRWVDCTMAAAERLGISVVFTVVNKDVIRKIYSNAYFDNVRFEQTLTGFVPEDLIDREVPRYEHRPVDVSYRARKLPAWCGSFALQKWQIGQRFSRDAKGYGLKCDIAMSEDSRIYGECWTEFVANSKAVLGTESGASVVDYSGGIQKAIDAYEAANPKATFEEIRDRFLNGRDGEVVVRAISPRCFEAACLKTLMIMYPGEYSGILKAGRHYVALAPDHSNFDEVVAILRDPERASEIIHNTYEEIARSGRWTFKSFIAHFDRVLEEATLENLRSTLNNSLIETQSTPHGVRIYEKIDALERENFRLIRRTQRMMRVRMFEQRLRSDIIRFLSKRLPVPIADPLLRVGGVCRRTLRRAMKPVL